jgi:hypothetical protein
MTVVIFMQDPRDTLKMIRESLCRIQSAGISDYDSDLLQRMINDIDRQRPLGPDGKHGKRHTLLCGCEDR